MNEHGPYLNESESQERVNGSASGVKVSEHDIQESELTESVIYVRVQEKLGVTEIQESVKATLKENGIHGIILKQNKAQYHLHGRALRTVTHHAVLSVHQADRSSSVMKNNLKYSVLLCLQDYLAYHHCSQGQKGESP